MAAAERKTSGGGAGDATSPTGSGSEMLGGGSRTDPSPEPGSAASGFLRNSALGSLLSGWDAEKLFSMAPSVPANLRNAFNADPDPSIVVTTVDARDQVTYLPQAILAC